MRSTLFRARYAEHVVLLLIVVYTLVFSYFSILKHRAFLSTAWDLGVYEQALWTTLNRGKLFYYTPDLAFNPGGSFFGLHFSPILFLILPIYAIYQAPETLLVLQSFILALGALPLFWLARDELKSPTRGLVFAFVYLLYPALHFVNMFDFHSEAFLPAFFLFAFYYLRKQKWYRYFLFLSLSLMTIEYVPAVITFCLGVYGMRLYAQHNRISLKNIKQVQLRRIQIVVRDKQALVALLTMVMSIFAFVLATSVKTYFNSEGAPIPHPMWVYGTTPESLIVGVLSNPSKAVQVFFTAWADKFLYLVYLFGPVAFLSFLDPPTLLLTAPWLLISFLSTGTVYYDIVFQYSAFVTPFVFISTIYGVRRILRINSSGALYVMKKMLMLMTVTSLIFSLSVSPLGINSSIPKVTTHDELLNKIISLIPTEASILTQNDIFPHVSRRLNAYLYPPSPQFSFDYMLVDTTTFWYVNTNAGVPGLAETPTPNTLLLEMLASGNYGIYASGDGILLLKQGYLEEPVLFIPVVKTFTHANLSLADDPAITKQYDPTSRSGDVLVRRAGGVQSPVFWYGPYVSFLPGLYEVTFRLKTSSTDVGYIATLDVAGQITKVLSNRRVYGHDFSQPDEWNNITLQFLSTIPQVLEFRGLEVTNSTNLYLDFIEVRQISAVLKEKPLPCYFDFRELVLGNGGVKGNLLVHSPKDALGTFWYGPYITLPPGTYNATLWLKVSSPESGLLLTLDVATDLGKLVLVSRNITNIDFHGISWQAFTLTFQLDKTTPNIEFRGMVLSANSEIILSNIELHKVG